MAIPKLVQTHNSHGLLSYVLDDDPHSTKYVQKRNLLVDGVNIRKDYTGQYNSLYTEAQFYTSRKMAHKRNKNMQAYHLILSFSDQEFPLTSDIDVLKQQARDAMKISKGFLAKQLPDNSQYLLAVQRDGDGAKLHVHVAINSILQNGRSLNTNDLSIKIKHVRVHTKQGLQYETRPGLFDNLQTYMHDNFKELTGRDYTPVSLDPDKNKKDVQLESTYQIMRRGGVSWREKLKDAVRDIAQKATSLKQFKKMLKDVYGVHVRQRQAKDPDSDTGKRKAYTYQIMGTRKDGKQYVVHSARDFHITKRGAVRGLGEFARPINLENVILKNNQKIQQAQQKAQRARLAKMSPLERTYEQLKQHIDYDNNHNALEEARKTGKPLADVLEVREKRRDKFEDVQRQLHDQNAKKAQKAQKAAQTANEISSTPSLEPVRNPDTKKTASEVSDTSKEVKKSQDTVEAKQIQQRVAEQQQKRAQQKVQPKKRKKPPVKPVVHHYFDDSFDGLVPINRKNKGHDFIQNMYAPGEDEDENEKYDGLDK